MPLQYVIGTQPFGEIEVKCRPGVLIPRWETEEWCGELIRCLKKLNGDGGGCGGGVLRMVDVCTGTGCIPLRIASEVEGVHVTGIDISDEAIALSEENQKHNGVPSERVLFRKGDMFDVPPPHEQQDDESVEVVTSNPPYIPLRDYRAARLERSVKLYEPELALVGDVEHYDALIRNFVVPLKADAFVFELGYREQFEYTVGLLGDEWETWLYHDGAGKERCVVGYRKGTRMSVLEKLRR